MVMRRYFSLVFLLLMMIFIILLKPLNCRAASLPWESISPVDNTITVPATTAACNSGHRCLVDDEVNTNLFSSMDPQYLNSLASESKPKKGFSYDSLKGNSPAVDCTKKENYSSCLGAKQIAKSSVCTNAAPYCRYPPKF